MSSRGSIELQFSLYLKLKISWQGCQIYKNVRQLSGRPVERVGPLSHNNFKILMYPVYIDTFFLQLKKFFQ